MCGGGPSSSEQNLAAQQASFYQTLQQGYQQQFAGQADILNSLKSTFEPILQAGPGQFGFTAPETAALRTQAQDSTAMAYQNAARAVGERTAGAGGGNQFLPSGGAQELQQLTANAAASQEASQQLGITQAGYAQGLQNFQAAANALGGAAQIYNPASYAGQANSAGNDAFSSAQTIWQQQQQSSPWNIVGGILGGAVGAGLNAFTGGLGGLGASALGKSFGSGGGTGNIGQFSGSGTVG